MSKIHLKDKVIITSGKNKNKISYVIKVLKDRFILKNINLVTKHIKPNPNLNILGGLIKIESPIHVSNIAIYNKITNKPDKVIYKFKKKKKIRYYKSNNKIIE